MAAIAALVVGAWGLAVAFQLLALTGTFHLGAVLPLGALLAAAAWRFRERIGTHLVSLRSATRDEASALASELRSHRAVALIFALLGAHTLLRVSRALITPSFAWDDFTYHLHRAGRWVQDAGIELQPAPDAWTYYEFFPWGGDLVWAWAMLLAPGDVGVPFAASLAWASCGLAAYVLARRIGQSPLAAAIVASAIALLPSQVSLIASAYVDNPVLALFLAATLFALELWRGRARNDPRRSQALAFLLGAACGLGVLVKTSFLPLIPLAPGLVLWLAATRRQPRLLLAAGLGAAVVLPNWIHTALVHGSPFYPFRVHESLPFNPALYEGLARYAAEDHWAQLLRVPERLFWNAQGATPFLNLGVAGALLLAMGIAGAWRRRGDDATRALVVWGLAASILTASQLFHPSNGTLLTLWSNALGRFLVPSLAVGLLFAGHCDARWLRGLLLPVVAIEVFAYGPRLWPQPILGASLVVGAGAIALASLAFFSLRRASRPGAWAAVALALVWLGGVAGLHERYRYTGYRLFAEGRLDDFHAAEPIGSWPIWQKLDALGPTTVAASAGSGMAGHNWFRYGLLGARLQNRVLYVPVTPGGSIVSYADARRAVALSDRRAWLERLDAQAVEWFVAMAPAPLELFWMRQLPGIFALEEQRVGEGQWTLARIDRDALRRALDSNARD